MSKEIESRIADRRRFLSRLALGVAALPLLRLTTAQAADKLTTADPSAQALGYTEDSSKLDAKKEANFKAGSKCSGCALFQGAQMQGGYAPCSAFGGKLVNQNGWCRAFAPKA